MLICSPTIAQIHAKFVIHFFYFCCFFFVSLDFCLVLNCFFPLTPALFVDWGMLISIRWQRKNVTLPMMVFVRDNPFSLQRKFYTPFTSQYINWHANANWLQRKWKWDNCPTTRLHRRCPSHRIQVLDVLCSSLCEFYGNEDSDKLVNLTTIFQVLYQLGATITNK